MGVEHTHRHGRQGHAVCPPGHGCIKADGPRRPEIHKILRARSQDGVLQFWPGQDQDGSLFTTIKIITGLLMSIALIQFLYSSVRIRNQEKSEMKKCEKTCEI